MRVHRSVQILTILTTLVACSSGGGTANGQPDAAAAAPPVAAPVAAPDPTPAPSLAVNVQWDSGPLDLAYRRERSDMDARHIKEASDRRSSESADQRGRRQATEKQALELRYTRGKASHSRTLPGSDR